MRYDLHNHTWRCNHATGTMDEYIQRAIQQGLDGFGFSCHAPMSFDEENRMPLSDLEAYRADVLELQVRYQGQCDIKLGLEVDYLPGFMEESVLNFPADYLIGSVHFLDDWGFDNPAFIAEYAKRDINETWRCYLQRIEAMAESRLFDIVGHFDLLKVFGYRPSEDLSQELGRTLDAIKSAGMALELNAAGWRKKVAEAYPSESILQEARSREIPITFSSDAHAPEQVGFKRIELENLAKKVGYSDYVIFTNRQKEYLKIP